MFIKPQHTTEGYLFVHFPDPKKKGKRVNCRINRLVAMHFIPNPYNKPEVNHIDGNKENNNVSNLEWATRSENMKHCFSMGLHPSTRGENSHVATHTEEQILKIAELLCNPNLSLDDIANITGERKKFIQQIREKNNWGWLTKDFNFVNRGQRSFKEFHQVIDDLVILNLSNAEIIERLPNLGLTRYQLRKLIDRRRRKMRKLGKIIECSTTK